MRRGEVRWYQFARPDKRRPVLILTRDSAIDMLAETTIAPITGTVRDVPSEVILTELDGMPEQCAVNMYYIQTVNKSRIGAVITTLSDTRMYEVREALLFALGF